MSERLENLTILFVDVVGSTKLYETLGDTLAHQKIVGCLTFAANFVETHSGKVIEVIGDELMCSFPTANDAALASLGIQSSIGQTDLGMQVRIGFHHGSITFDAQDHPFGDTINVAARMAGLSKAGQIIITECVHQALHPDVALQSRPYGEIAVKGKAIPMKVFELLASQDDCTLLFSKMTNVPKIVHRSLLLKFNGTQIVMGAAHAGVVTGRSTNAGLQVPSETASRSHVKVSFRNGKFIVTDQSTNGTYIQMQPGHDGSMMQLFLHREEWPAFGKGHISLGAPRDKNPLLCVWYECVDS